MKTQTKDLKLAWQACLMVMLTAVVIMLPDLALAAAGDTLIGDTLCTMAGWFSGSTGRGIATIGVTIIGIGALLGKVSWGMAIIVGLGVAVVFGAGELIDVLGGAGSACP